MTRTAMLAIVASLMMAGTALADPIEGKWKTEAGSTAQIAPCGGQFCIKLIDGSHAGKTIGKMAREGDEYKGTITDPADDKTYQGKAWLASSSRLKMRGYSGIFFKTQTWARR
jgi:uncharacterized protein (DUF2147 family)